MAKGLPSPRRSSRARTHQPPSVPSAAVSNAGSSANSSTSGRADRPTRSGKAASPPKSSTPHSLSPSEEQNDATSTVTTRRSRRQQETTTGDAMAKAEDSHPNDDEIIEDEETTRCICGSQDWPGLPVIENTPKPTKVPAVAVPTDGDDADVPDEPGSLFIQCETCAVWQHGGCVGIMEEPPPSFNYYCEQCRPDFHHLSKDHTGQKYSRYIPTVGKSSKSHRKLSISEARPVRESSLKVPAEPPKRRSTMNSRAALDEDEVLRKVLEESKQDGAPSETSTRKVKRNREDSEDMRSDLKRQRTNSSTPPSSGSKAGSVRGMSEVGDDGKRKGPRSTAPKSQGHKDKDVRDKERAKAEAASKRRDRAERRRADDPELPDENGDEEETLPTEEATPNAATNAEDAPASAPTNNLPTQASASTSKRIPPGLRRKGVRGGRSALTPREGDIGSPAKNGKGSPSPKEGAGSGADSSGTGQPTTLGNGARPKGRPPKDRNDGQPRLPTMAELNRRATQMQEFIAHAQKEMAQALPVVESAESSNSAASMAASLSTRLSNWKQEYAPEVESTS
ncbi:hypothetical protein BT63DRAFT_419132 [Microthyrium microscopicum]|uniref:Zinc finger PHD-type domain-containing protein n=1 Tax=Microthyrium microscopicum TaxID=703497 RepID=A0A6A6TV40_9PEZI|nr:hypothetical protein BT63DRAFT_419132 [Microthyrium microscopicum]